MVLFSLMLSGCNSFEATIASLATTFDPRDGGSRGDDMFVNNQLMTNFKTGILNVSNETFVDMALRPDGKVVVLGHRGSNDFILARFNADGILDTTFGSNGMVSSNVGYPAAIYLQDDGKILVASQGFEVVRYNSEGSLDLTFNGTGIATAENISICNFGAAAMTVDATGNILVAGCGVLPASVYPDFTIVRFKPDGSLDTGFNGAGVLMLDLGSDSWDDSKSVKVQADGKIVVAGTSTALGGYSDLAIIRVNSNGTLDTSFNGTGVVLEDTAQYGTFSSLKIQGDGKILVGGETTDYATFSYFTLARYNTNGSLDTTFNTTGILTTDVSLGNEEYIHNLELQSDGKILASGAAYDAFGKSTFATVRYLSDGTLDASFGATGVVFSGFGGEDASYQLLVQPDGRFILGGKTDNYGSSDFGLIRHNADGSVDSSFGTLGKIVFDLPISSDDGANGINVQSNGKLVVSGYSCGSDCDFALARYGVNGELDPSFGVGGRVTTDFGSGSWDMAYAAKIQSDDKIIVMGLTDWDVALVRYDAHGALDTSFGVGGFVVTDISSNDRVSSLALQDNGKILVLGTAVAGGIEDDCFVARYNANGALDSGFGTGGIAVFDAGSTQDMCSAMALQSDGKIVVAGFGSIGWYSSFVARLNIDGSLDSGFGVGGIIHTSLSGISLNAFANALAIQDDGKILVAGSASGASGDKFLLLRYNVDGSLDSSFNGTGMIITDRTNPMSNSAQAIRLQSNGKIVVGGSDMDGNARLLRFNGNGSIDTSYASSGVLSHSFGTDSTAEVSALTEVDGVLYAVGRAEVAGGSGDFALLRAR